MKRLTKFLIAHRQFFLCTGFALMLLCFVCALSACAAPTWLTDASSVITLVGGSVTSIASFIAGLTGNVALAAALAVVSQWIVKVQTGIADLETLIDQYNAAPNPTVLANIEQALADVKANLTQDFGNLGLPASVLSVITGIVALALQQLVAWGTLIPALKITADAATTLTVTPPMTKAAFKAAVNKILTTPTGDPATDAALKKVKKL